MRKMISTLDWVGNEDGYLKLIDQTKLPHKLTYLKCTTMEQVADAIKRLAVRGAPAIGVAAAFGAYLGIRGYNKLHKVTGGYKRLQEESNKVYQILLSTRPTAVNLRWALDRIDNMIKQDSADNQFNQLNPVVKIIKGVYNESLKILKEDRETCYRIGLNGAKLIKNGYHILTHCNAGLLATAGIGTALAPMYIAKKQGRKFSVYSSETRPVLQGARLTVWELQRNHIPVTLICDNMVGSLMKQGKIDPIRTNGRLRRPTSNGVNIVIVGADRIARNGDTANKIGTYQVALLAHHHKIPFYIAAPMSTFDRNIRIGKDIPIEYRSPEEVTQVKMTDERGKMREVQIAPRHTRVYNPAFDVTPAKYISGYITERGIITARQIPRHF
ncbi:MAG: S-methyl-5-thioribose-1-phosphate isomerase [Planctomycetes bacterium]|nr:S-methyl-5-thioribose-1-phosphate isomerase [Planctomycetota bacterium]